MVNQMLKLLQGLTCLLLLLIGSGCNTVPPEETPPATTQRYNSIQLISQDLSSGKINQDEAYLFKTYTIYDAKKLPKKYASDLPFKGATMVIRDLRRAFDGLGEETKESIRPYLFPEGRKEGKR